MDFEKWLINQDWFDDFYVINDEAVTNHCDLHKILPFDKFPKSMQYGVYVDFFDSVGVSISIEGIENIFCYEINTKNGFANDFNFKTRQETRAKAIEKANEIYNNG